MAVFTKHERCTSCNLKLNIFQYLKDEELEQINKNRFEVQFKKDETIFKQGGPLTHIACITSGKAKVYLEGDKGKNIIFKILKGGELVGGPGFKLDNRHHFSVTSITDARACFIDINDFELVVKQNIDFSMALLSHLNNATVNLYNILQSHTQKHMHGRVADMLLYLSQRIYLNTSFETTLSRQDLADMSSMTKESAIRILKEFKDDKIIKFEGNNFKILDPENLQTISKRG